MCETIFGKTITLSSGRILPTRFVAEQHITEDLGFIPSMQDWFKHIEVKDWMMGKGRQRIEGEI